MSAIIGTTQAQRRGALKSIYESKDGNTVLFANEQETISTPNGDVTRLVGTVQSGGAYVNQLFDRRFKKDGSDAKPVQDKKGNQLVLGTQQMEGESDADYAKREARLYIYNGTKGQRGYLKLPGGVPLVNVTLRQPKAKTSTPAAAPAAAPVAAPATTHDAVLAAVGDGASFEAVVAATSEAAVEAAMDAGAVFEPTLGQLRKC
jgi:hypothetical protein